MSNTSADRIPHGWVQARLGDLVGLGGVFCDGDWVESKDQDPRGDIRLIQLADVGDGTYRDKSSRFLTAAKALQLNCTSLEQGDLLIARMPEPLGRTCIFPGDTKRCVTVVDVCIVRLASPINSRWLMHQLNSPHVRQRIAALQSGSTRKRISRLNLAKVTFPVPPQGEQATIADTIDELFSDLDSAVAALERVRAKLKLYRASVLKAAVEGELTAEWRAQNPPTESADDLLQRILEERRRRWEEDELARFEAKGQKPPNNWRSRYREPAASDSTSLPALPVGWRWSSLGECFGVHVGATPSRAKKDYWNGDIPWVASGEVQFCHISDTREKITPLGLANASTSLNPRGSVILNMIGEGATRGKAAILDIDACNNQNCAAIRVSATPVSPELIYCWLVYQYEQNRKLGSGNNQPAMNQSIVQSIAFPLPPLAEQEKIVEVVEEQMSLISHLESEIELKIKSASALRQSILRHAFSGRLVPQDPNDEPASELLKRIAAERESRARAAAGAKKGAARRKPATQTVRDIEGTVA